MAGELSYLKHTPSSDSYSENGEVERMGSNVFCHVILITIMLWTRKEFAFPLDRVFLKKTVRQLWLIVFVMYTRLRSFFFTKTRRDGCGGHLVLERWHHDPHGVNVDEFFSKTLSRTPHLLTGQSLVARAPARI